MSNVDGFRAKVHYQSEGTSKYQDVLIKDGAFRVGDTKFSLVQQGTAMIANVVTDPATGSTYLDQGLRLAEDVMRALVAGSGAAIRGAHPGRRVLAEIEGVEIGAAAQHGFFRILPHHQVGAVVDHLIDHGTRVAVDDDLVR